VLLDRKNFAPHFAWFLIFAVGTVGAVVWYAVASRGRGDWPGGSSLPGFVCGTAAGLIILFEFLLWPRKTVWRVWRIGRTQTWLRAHLWLGLLTVPLIAVHAWRELGGMLSTLLVVLFAIVILSGLFGLAMQQFLPRIMLERTPAETIYSQIDFVAERGRREAEELVAVVCGAEAGDGSENSSPAAAVEPADSPFVTVGAMRSVGAVRGRVLQTQVIGGPVPDAEPLRAAFNAAIRPYLQAGANSNSTLVIARRAEDFFQGLRSRLPAAAHPAVAALEELCDQRRQFDLQKRLHGWLHAWLLVHLPLSVALVLLMLVHVFVALKYW
jgi:hypothetical protein